MITGEKIRVLIADDSAFMRRVLQGILESDAAFEVVGQACDGREAVEKAASLNPHVITMDLNMPYMDGLEATGVIMSTHPRPIVIVSSESREGADATLKALELGAIDFVAKPNSGIDLDMSSVREEILRKLRVAAKVRVVRTAVRSNAKVTLESLKKVEVAVVPAASPIVGSAANGRTPIVVLGASTGGPATLMKLVPSFPAGFPAAIVVVQHMPGAFTAQFAEQLASVTPMRVKEAEAGEPAEPGTIYVCPGNNHLRILQTGRFALDDGPRISGYKPNIDVALESVAAFAGPASIAVILTGMGNDGSRGIQAVHEQGGCVIAQDEATSIIFGMPAEAIKTGVVGQVLPLEKIAEAVERRVLQHTGTMKAGAV